MPSLLAVLGLDANPFNAGLKSAKVQANRAGSAIGSALTSQIAGFLSVAAVGTLVRSTIQWASSLEDASENLRVSVEWFQKLVNGAELFGASLEDVAKLLDTINKNRSKPGKAEQEAFGRLGFTPVEVQTMNRQKFFDKLTERFKNGASDQDVADLETVGGKSSRRLRGALMAGFSSDVPALQGDTIRQLDDVGDKLSIVGLKLKQDFAPMIVFVGEVIDGVVKKIKAAGSLFGGFSAGFQEGFQDKGGHGAVLGFFHGLGAGLARGVDEGLTQAGNEQMAMDERDAALERTKKAQDSLRKTMEQGPANFEPPEDDKAKEKKQSRQGEVNHLQLNALQQVGAYVAQSPDRRFMIDCVKAIRDGVTTIAKNSGGGTQPGSGTKF